MYTVIVIHICLELFSHFGIDAEFDPCGVSELTEAVEISHMIEDCLILILLGKALFEIRVLLCSLFNES